MRCITPRQNDSIDRAYDPANAETRELHWTLVEAYSMCLPTYAESVLTALLALTGKPAAEIDVVDVGAGTGIWTRMLARAGCWFVIAVEPNGEIR